MSDFKSIIGEFADILVTKTVDKTVQHLLAVRPIPHRYLTTKEASIYLGLSVDALQLWRAEERGPEFLRLNRAIRYDRLTLDAWMGGTVPGIDGRFVGAHTNDIPEAQGGANS